MTLMGERHCNLLTAWPALAGGGKSGLGRMVSLTLELMQVLTT